MAADATSDQRFVAEAREHLAAMTAALIALERGDADPRAHVEQLLRSSHSIKGGAGFIGRRRIEQLAHAMETAVEHIRDGRAPALADSIDALLAALDRVSAMVDDVEHSDDADIEAPLQRLHALSETSRAPMPDVAVRPAEPVSTAQPAEFPMSDRVRSGWHQGGGFLYGVKLDWFACERDLRLDAPEVARRLQSAGTVLDSRMDLSGPPLEAGLPTPPLWFRAILSSSLEPQQFAARLDIACAAILRLQNVPRESPRPAPEPPPKPPTASSSLRISVPLIDRMMELAAELSLVRNEALRSSDPANAAMRRLMRRLDSVTSDLQDAALRMRMQPVGGLFDRFPRLVRDLARQLGKQIDLHVSGAQVELDKTVLEILADPLTHLIRNCCDHGIESPDARVRSGKPATGAIRLSARQDRGQIVIEVRDDGKGIDPEAIRRKALEQGLKARSELDAISNRQLYDLILLSGFSTASRVTDLSGRGVGMDVVKTNLDQVGGSVEIDSAVGQGTLFSLRLPLTLAIMPCLLVSSEGSRYAIAQRELEEIVLIDPEARRAKIECTQDEEVLRLRGQLVPVLRLSEILASRDPFDAPKRAAMIARFHDSTAARRREYVAILRVGSHRFGLLVDDVLESEDIVVKPLHPLLRTLGVFGAATILGDGGVAMILSGEGVARHGGIMHRPSAPSLPPPAAGEALHRILLFRCGPVELLALPLDSVQRVVAIHRTDIQRMGDRELVTIDSAAVNVLRLDRFLGLSACPDADRLFLIVPRFGEAALLVSQIIDTRAVALEPDPQAYQADGVRGTLLLDGQIALLLDLDRLMEIWQRVDRGSTPALPPAESASVLVVEDTQFFQRLIRSLLEQAGYRVAVAENGREGLERLQSEAFDLIVSDIEMPELDGYAFAQRVREDARFAGVPMLAVTTLSSPEHRDRALAGGFDAFEVKLERGSFLGAVRTLLQHGRSTTISRGSHE